MLLNSGSPPKVLHILHNTEYPMSTFACLENGSCLIADRGFDSVMPKIKGCYETRKGAKIEVAQNNTCRLILLSKIRKKFNRLFIIYEFHLYKAKGQRYELGDFVIKIGQVTVGVSFKGILIEVFLSEENMF